MILVQHCTNNGEYSTCYLRQYHVFVSQQCHRIASFLRLDLTQISSVVFHRYLGNAVLDMAEGLQDILWGMPQAFFGYVLAKCCY